jgi:hypothetical protein
MPKDMCVPMDAETLAALDVDILVPQSNWVRLLTSALRMRI